MFILVLFMFGLSFGIGIEEAMKTALENSPEIKALEEELKVFDGMELSAGAFPNPEVRLESGFITNDKDGKPKGKAFNLMEFDQPIPLWGVRSKGRAVISEEREAFKDFAEAKKREILARVYRSFYRALTNREILRIQRENLKIAQEVEEFVKKAYNLGEVTELELLRAQREKNFALLQVNIASSEYEASLKELSALLAKEVNEVEGALDTQLYVREVDIDTLPSVLNLKKRIEAFRKRIELEKALAKPSVKLGFVVEDSEEGYYGLRGSLSFDIPVFYRRQGEILQHLYRKQTLMKRLQAEINRLTGQLASAKIRLRTLQDELRRLENIVIPSAQEELELALKSYRLRVISLLELSDVRRRYYELLVNRAQLLMSMHEVYAELVEIGGWR